MCPCYCKNFLKIKVSPPAAVLLLKHVSRQFSECSFPLGPFWSYTSCFSGSGVLPSLSCTKISFFRWISIIRRKRILWTKKVSLHNFWTNNISQIHYENHVQINLTSVPYKYYVIVTKRTLTSVTFFFLSPQSVLPWRVAFLMIQSYHNSMRRKSYFKYITAGDWVINF